MTSSPKKSSRKLAANRRALHDFEVLERLEAGVALCGTEVKSVKNAQSSLAGAYARVEHGAVLLYGFTIQPYVHGNRFNHDPERPKRLLLHRAEIHKLQAQIEQKGCAVVPLSVYLKRGLVKIEIGVCKGKRQSDKRETLRRKTAEREAERAIARAR